jgi:uncharacterized protein YcbX
MAAGKSYVGTHNLRRKRPLWIFRRGLGRGRLGGLQALLMSADTPSIHAIYRYPVKGLSPEPLTRTRLAVGETLPADRLYAIENGPSDFDHAAPRYQPKQRYLMLMRNARLARLRTRIEDTDRTLAIELDGREAARGDLQAPDGSFSDVARKVVSIINLASVAAIEDLLGVPVHPLRFRANLYVTGWPAWHEFDLVGQDIAIGKDARLKIVKRIVRCAATDVDPDTGIRDLSIPPTLMRSLGHADCGVYGEVVNGGDIVRGDELRN